VPLELNRARLDEILGAVADRLEGDWLLVGGALSALWLRPERVTEDVDIFGLSGHNDDRLKLLQLGQDLGLPIEALNSAVDFFVRQIEGWRDEIELFRTGARGRIFRPTPTLYLLLKVKRLSEDDLEDCLAAIERARSEGMRLDAQRVIQHIAGLAPPDDPAVAARRDRLKLTLGT
jgi:hypothetical protein